MAEKQDLDGYVAEHIDEAIKKEEIKIYYQPIIRSLTGEVCGNEALARWDDPVYGLLEPASFIPILEERRLIHKLDLFVIKKICSHLSHCAARKDPFIPISFNLSYLDFELCDVIEALNSETEKNQVPRQMIRVEINESLVVHTKERIKEKINELHSEGYEIVMDDFGTGRSSLNILKDYKFDELKIDMRVLWGVDDRSGKIMGYLCSMAKALGIKTAAESVESREQMEFLRKIGCEKLQGFFFEKPMFYWDLLPSLREKGLKAEPLSLKAYYDLIGQSDIRERRNSSYAIVEFVDERSRFLYLNEKYYENIMSLGITDLNMLEDICNDPESTLNIKFLQMIKRSKESESEQVVDFVWKGNYCIVKFRYLTGSRKRDAYEIELENLSINSRASHLQKINDALEGVYSVFDRVVRYDVEKDRVAVLHSDTGFTGKYESSSFSENVNAYTRNEIYPEDRERYRQFSDFSNVGERIVKSGRSFISGCFRFKSASGNFVWREQYIIPAREQGSGEQFLLLTKEVDEKQFAILMQLSSFVPSGYDPVRSGPGQTISEDVLWRNVVESCPVGIFWKDRERKFLGVNKAFLDYYGFDSEEEILGKTDEDMNWHVDPVPFKTDEENIIKNGIIIKDAVGKCLAKGENRDIMANKVPILQDGQIVGIIGYFRDITERTARYDVLKNVSLTDQVTGVLNTLGIMEAVSRYEAAYVENDTDFAMSIFTINHYKDLRNEYGEGFMDSVMAAIALRIKKSVGSTAVVGRPGTDRFLIINQVERTEEGSSFLQRISRDIASISEVNGIPCTIYTSAGYAVYSECGSGEALYSAAVKRMNDQAERMRRFTGGF